ncbi:DUF1433 domain-containing protein [Staphylococcus edaphicus]
MLNESKRQHYVDIQKKRIELFFKENINNYQNIKITETGKTPMGGYTIRGYINNNKELDFIATMNGENGFQFDDEINYSKALSHAFNTKNASNKFPSQIIKEKKLNKDDFEADPPFIFGF